MLTCAHNVVYKKKSTDTKFTLADGVKLFLGKWNKELKEMINTGYMLDLAVTPENIIYAPNFNGHGDCGFDLALLGITKENNQKLQTYLENHEKIK